MKMIITLILVMLMIQVTNQVKSINNISMTSQDKHHVILSSDTQTSLDLQKTGAIMGKMTTQRLPKGVAKPAPLQLTTLNTPSAPELLTVKPVSTSFYFTEEIINI